jgi:hypothetical protein
VLAIRLIRTAIAFFVIGVGIYMGAAQDFRLTHVHVHINLLGWMALAAIGLMYNAFPALQRNWLAHAHYWLHVVGLCVFMGGFAWGVLRGGHPFAPLAIGSSMVGLGVILTAVNVGKNLRAA